MKKLFIFILCLLTLPLAAGALPDNVYFRAMKDEMNRTKKELRVKGSPKPFFTAYKLIERTSRKFDSSFGVAYAAGAPQTSLKAQVYMYAGDAKNNSSGFYNETYYYSPSKFYDVARSYEGLRRALWEATDMHYVKASGTYEKKMAYKRQKNMTQGEPDFTKALHSGYVEQIPPFAPVDEQKYQALADELSAVGKRLPYAELFFVSLRQERQNVYFLDSEGDFYQYSVPSLFVHLKMDLRTRDGYKETLQEKIPLLAGAEPDKQALLLKTEEFAARGAQLYQAKKAEPYVGPVLLRPHAAAGFFNQLFVKNTRYPKPLLSSQYETDATAGQFKDKTGMRVLSQLFDVYDRPRLREYEGVPLAAFMPVDDEGVSAEELQLVQNGKLIALPAARSPMQERQQKHSNGRARMSDWILPRANLTNVFFVPKNPLASDQMEEKLLARCRELELEYCYIFPRFPSVRNGRAELNLAFRIYSADGRKEPVYGIRLEGVTARSLRDVIAAADDEQASSFSDPETDVAVSVVAPSIIVDEIEIAPTQRRPDRKPFVPLP